MMRMLRAHTIGDFCLVGAKGVGKSLLVQYFASVLGYRVVTIPVFKDMTAQSLLQMRTTKLNGDTVWHDSGLVQAALAGDLRGVCPRNAKRCRPCRKWWSGQYRTLPWNRRHVRKHC